MCLRTEEQYKPSTYKKNNMKKMSDLLVDLWKVADVILWMFFVR